MPRHEGAGFTLAPPNWWRATRRHELRLMIRGRGLGGAAWQVTPATFRLVAPRASTDGDYAFVSLEWRGEPAVEADLRVRLASGAVARLPFRFRAGPRPDPAGFGPDDVLYLIMVDRFADAGGAHGATDRAAPRAYHGGDLLGIERHLGYLERLGVTALWLTPIYDNGPPQDYHGYGAIDEYRVEEHFGDLASLRELIAAAHRGGLKVIQDQVANHVGPTNPWVGDPPTPTWLHGSAARHATASFDYAALADPHAPAGARAAVTDGWFAGILPDLDQADPEVAAYEIENSLWWLGQAGFDGIREDTLPMVPCRFWRQWSAALAQEFPTARVVGEVLDRRLWVTAYFERQCAPGAPLTVFDYPLYFALRDVFIRDRSFAAIRDVLARDRLYRDPQRLVTFLGNHDVPRFVSAAGGPSPAAEARLAMAFTFLLTVRGTPLIYYGDEIGMAGGGDPDDRRDFPGGFAGDAHDAFVATGRDAAQNRIWNRVHRLLELRRRHVALRRGVLTELLVAPRLFAYLRRAGGDRALVAFNNSDQPAVLPLDRSALGGAQWRPALGVGTIGPEGAVRLPARAAEIFFAAAESGR